MSLRFTTLVYPAIFKHVKNLLVFLLLAFACPVYSQEPLSMEDLEEDADKSFSEGNFTEAYKLYSQLVSNFPKDPEFNYRLGISMLYSEPEKKKSITYLKFAASNPAEAPKDVKFYLGKAYHVNYLFDEAIKNYNEFKLTAPASQQKKLQVDHEINAAANGKRLLSNLTDLEILNKTQLPESDYFRNYKKIGGKLLVKPDEFKTSTDKKKKEKSIVFLPNGSNVVYYSSYGDNADNGKDIYTSSRLPDGKYSKPQKVAGINTELDEDYPFLHPDGKTLYFASKGHNSMGGYDIFKSVFNESTNTWGPPVNMEFPINSPDDDFLFVTDSLETIAYFSTGRQSPPGKIDVLKVKTTRRPIDILAIKGSVIMGNPEHSLQSTINVRDLFSDDLIGTYNAEENGNYDMELPNGAKLVFTVETPGLETQSAQVSMPMASASKPYRQTISYEKGKLKVLNYFDEAANDQSYLQYLKVIEKKAKLEVNEGKVMPVAAAETSAKSDSAATVAKTEKTPQISSEQKTATATATAADPSKGVDNKQLAKMARQDAQDSRMEAAQLKRDYEAANQTGLKQKEEADRRLTEATEAITKAEAITNDDEKKAELEKAYTLKAAAENDQMIASRILTLAQSLGEDAANKEKEAALNDQYAAELDKTLRSKNGNKESLAKLEELQKQISDLSQQKNSSENVVNTIKTDIDEKEKQIASAEGINSNIKNNLNEIKNAIGEKESELSATKKKSAKQKIAAQISELKAEQEEKEKQIAGSDLELLNLNDELTALKSELEIATKITSENIEVKATAVSTTQATNKTLQDKYKDKIAISDSGNKTSIEESSQQLINYNNEIDQTIARNKTTLAKTKDKNGKQKITNEIKALEATKKQNQQQLVSNDKQLAELTKSIAQNNEAAKTTYDPITAETPADAIAKLDNLSSKLATNDNQNFDFNGYQNPAAQSLKVEADAKINDAIARQKKLKDEIATSKSDIENTSAEAQPVMANVEQLNKEAEEIVKASQKLRDEAKTKSGSEKEKLLAEAKNLDDQANDKYIQAADVIRNDNTAVVAANQENIQNLLKEGKSNEADVTLAKNLNEEAKTAFRKAADIRLEANSLTSKGAKLGNFSNAEEKEAEAILKQKQAIETLTMSNPLFKLKVPVTSSTSIAKATSSDAEGAGLNSKLEAVNSGLAELAAIKTESYQKLYEANSAEIEQLTADIKDNQNTVEANPSLKTDLISGNNKIENAKALKQTSDNAANPNEKLNNLVAAVKKQNEAIRQLSTVNTAVGKLASSAPKNPEINPGSENPVTTGTQPAGETNDPSASVPLDAQTVDVATLALKDTTASQVIGYFNNNAPAIRNAQANSMAQGSLSKLKDLDARKANIDSELASIENGTGSTAMTKEELNAKSQALNSEAEPLNTRSQELKKEAETKQGEDKNYTLAQARELEIQAQDKMIEAANYKQQANEEEYTANINAITELMDKLKTDNPDLHTTLSDKRTEYSPLKTQIRNLRDEANALNNKAAKLGAISNAEEKELELIQKQNEVLEALKKQYPDYVVKSASDMTPEEKKAGLEQKNKNISEQQYAELTNLTNAFSLEYESSKNSVPANLTPQQQTLKQNADDLNAESKRLLVQSAQEQNANEKIKLLTLAAKSGNSAVDQLNKLLPKFIPPATTNNDISTLNEIGNKINGGNNTARSAGNLRGTIKIDGLEVTPGNAYNNANPIPIDARMEEGLVFRVQIGAFKTLLPNNAFKGLSPLNGETTPSGYFRYTAGNFNKVENANAVKNDLRGLGYSDAFVVAYFNGKRISYAEAMAMMEKDGKTIDSNAPQTAGITSNINVPKAIANNAMQETVVVTKELDKIDGLLYTIQIGVYTKQITKPQLFNLRPIFREQLTNGLYRYTAGIYNNPDRIVSDKNKVVNLGVRDAFVSAYLNGKRVPFMEAKDRQSTDATLKMEPENPIIFPDANSTTPESTPSADPSVLPFKNDVTSYPATTPDNGIKTTEEGICFKVQIGAFSKQVPNDVAAKFSAIKTWPVENKQMNALFIYNIGNFSEAKFAKELKEEAVRLGITDAFITVYRDGRKVYGVEAETLLRE